jgi:N-acetylglutamate synthase-like GNAT family acetyltransferase
MGVRVVRPGSSAVPGATDPALVARDGEPGVVGVPVMSSVVIREASPEDEAAVEAFLQGHGTAVVARLGELVDARLPPALIAQDGARIAGVLTWIAHEESFEVLTLHVTDQWRGTGTALLDGALRLASSLELRRVWLITTHDNTDALRFYQRRGFRLARLHRGAVDRSRATLKPTIPELGLHGIPIRDELELELFLLDAIHE